MEEHKWHQIIASFQNTHVLQTWQWGNIKSQYRWAPFFKVWGDSTKPDAAALVLMRAISLAGYTTPLRILYVPKGPLLRNWGDQQLVKKVLEDLKEFAQEKKAIFIKIDPDVPLGSGIPGEKGAQENSYGREVTRLLCDHGWHYSDEQIQFRNSVWINLTPSEDELLSKMKQKTRYNIRLAERKGVNVRFGTVDDIEQLYRMYADTSLRDGFVIRDEGYYRLLWGTFMRPDLVDSGRTDVPACEPIIAEVNGLPVAAVVIFRFGGTAYYMHGMSLPVHRNRMPNYLLQWKAMIRAKELGCKRYDLWGAPEIFEESDSMWGVFRFKQGLGGEVVRMIGAYDLPIRKTSYSLYTRMLPRVLNFMRVMGFKRTQQLRVEA